MSEEKKEVEFETALKKLETIVENLENGELSLEAALKQYEEGVRMADICSKRLGEAGKRVEVLMKTSGGRFKAEPFPPKADPPRAGEGAETGRAKKKK
jgi:exodeoxyribonuclease VII small subunit